MRQPSLLLVLLAAAVVALLLAPAHSFQLNSTPQQRAWTARPRAAGAAGAAALSGRRTAPMTMVLDPASVLGDAAASAPSTLLAAAAWVGPAKAIVEPVLDLGGVAFLIRIILSWYPQIDLNKTPVNLIAWPTELFLKPTRTIVPPAFGVDISPIIWFAFLNFLREVLISDQGILTILQSK